MISFLIKFVICSGILLLVYRVLLANENMYRFNRIYLLFSLLFSLIVPAVTVSISPEDLPAAGQQIIMQSMVATPESPAPVQSLNKPQRAGYDWQLILSGIYMLVTTILLFRFLRNLYRIRQEVQTSTMVAFKDIKVWLTDSELTPHSFLNYIFISKTDYNNGLIEPEIICHEQAHVRQLHSFDVLFIELLQAVCWFNPFIPLYRKSIQLNHEFLADETVIKNYHNTPSYQYLLLAKASQPGSLQLTSQFNYQTTKKRLIMMTKTTSAKMAGLKKLAIAPVMAAALLLFTQKVLAKFPAPVAVPDVVPAVQDNTTQSIVEQFTKILAKYGTGVGPKGNVYQKSNFTAEDKAQLVVLFKQMSKEQQRQQPIKFTPVSPPAGKHIPTAELLNEWQTGAYGVWIDDKKIGNSDLANYKPSDFDLYSIGHLTKAAYNYHRYKAEISLLTKAAYAKYYQDGMSKVGGYMTWTVLQPIKKKSDNPGKSDTGSPDNKTSGK